MKENNLPKLQMACHLKIIKLLENAYPVYLTMGFADS